ERERVRTQNAFPFFRSWFEAVLILGFYGFELRAKYATPRASEDILPVMKKCEAPCGTAPLKLE
uniref:hypothetical protein n=1 Tax=Mammaliicoccus sp. F-M27 TaxID=2898687 RepID=UPI001EFB61CE